MTSVSVDLLNGLKANLKTADEIWIAVGLLNIRGLEFIFDAVPAHCKLNFVVGIDLPTDPRALSKLLSFKGKKIIQPRVLTENFFHPKVYLISSKGKLSAYVGSANCTMGGLKDNIEMSVYTKDASTCKNVLNWYNGLLIPNSQLLTMEFIRDYKPKYESRMRRSKKEKSEINKFKAQERIKRFAEIRQRRKFILALMKIRKRNDYLTNKRRRLRRLGKLRVSLDYPYFENIDLKAFFSIKDLGTIVPIKVKSEIVSNRRRFKNLMKFICNEEIPVRNRIDEALNGRLSIPNIGEAFISKVLVIHNARRYYLHNNEFKDRLRPFGLVLPRGLSFGEKYELVGDILKDIMRETNISDFATLDQCILRV